LTYRRGVVALDGPPEESGGADEVTATVADVPGHVVRALGPARVADVSLPRQNARRLTTTTTLVDSLFLGFNFEDNPVENGGFYTAPPDPMGVAGGSTLVAVVNRMIEIRRKDNGNLIARDSLDDFFGIFWQDIRSQDHL
jgi:hypothetical protein